MAFDTLLGNDQLKKNLALSLKKGHISHFYLISGPQGSGKRTLANLLAAAALCRDGGCGICAHCRKAASGSHPDFITVEDPEHKNVAVKIVRQIREDMFIRPNEGQNALLKILEEPPSYGVFILLTDNPAKLLPTVRSRCTELKLLPLEEKTLHRQLRMDFPKAEEEDLRAAMLRSGGFLGQARQLLEAGDSVPPQTEGFVRAFAARNGLLLAQTLVPLEKWKRDALIPLVTSWLELLESALISRSGIQAVSSHARTMAQSRSAQELHHGAATLKKALDYLQSNVSPAAVCGWLTWELR